MYVGNKILIEKFSGNILKYYFHQLLGARTNTKLMDAKYSREKNDEEKIMKLKLTKHQLKLSTEKFLREMGTPDDIYDLYGPRDQRKIVTKYLNSFSCSRSKYFHV